jgi:hypothetical protein
MAAKSRNGDFLAEKGPAGYLNRYFLVLQADYTPVEEKKKTKTKGGKSGEVVGEGEDAALLHQDWSQDQQRALELALAQFPKVIFNP